MSQLGDILLAAQDALAQIDGTGDFETDLKGRVYLGLRETRTEADGGSYIELTEGLPGRRRLSGQVMESGLSDQTVLRLVCWVTSLAVTDDTDTDAATEQARLLEEDIRRAMYNRQQLPLNGDPQAYYLAWAETEPIGMYLDELGRILFSVSFDVYYAATPFLAS